ncbi:hypothetical protein MMC17_000900 [Xylographa soralifera]|nr:hypothetical protein [Xylographa soralifera]
MDPFASPRVPPKAESLLKYDFEKLACHTSKLPRGYVFVPKGDVYITRHCRTLTGELGQTLYIVYDDATCERLGLRCPTKVFEEVNADAVASAPGRRDAVQAKDLRDDKKSRAAIRRLFPCMPIDSAENILEHGFQKGSGRVGRTTTLDEDRKVKLAVEAHIRHNFTPYEKLLRESKDGDVADDRRRERARAIIRPQVLEILAQWSSGPWPEVAASLTSVAVAPAFEVATVVTRPTLPIVGDAVTRNYYTRQAVRSTSESSVQMAALEKSIQARGPRWRIHKWSEDASVRIPTTPDISSHTSVRTAQDSKSIQKVSAVTTTTSSTKDLSLMKPRAVSLEASLHASISNKTFPTRDLVTSTQCSALVETNETQVSQSFTHIDEFTREHAQESAEKLSSSAAEDGKISSALSSSPIASKRKRTRQGNEDSPSAKQPRHAMAISSRHAVEEALGHIDMEVPSAVDSLPIPRDPRLYVDFDAMHLDDMAEPPYPTTANGPKSGNLSAENTSANGVAPSSHGGVPGSELEISVTKRVDDLRHEIRGRLSETKSQKPTKKPKSLPGPLESAIISNIKRLFKGQKNQSLIDLKTWQNDLQELTKFSERRQYNVILAEFRENLLLGRMDHSLYLMEHNKPDLPKRLKRRADDKFEAAVSAMIGVARKDYRMIEADPYYENNLSAERSWAAWQAFEFGKPGNPGGKRRLREVLRKHLHEKTGDKGSSKEKAFEILDDEEEGEEDEEGEILDNRVVSQKPSSLSKRPVRRPDQDHLENPFLARPRRVTGLDGANDSAQSEKEKIEKPTDKENPSSDHHLRKLRVQLAIHNF